MSESADIRVTGELRDMGDHWTCSAYGGSGTDPISVVVEAADEQAAKDAFVAEWNERAETEWAPEQFGWEYNHGRAEG